MGKCRNFILETSSCYSTGFRLLISCLCLLSGVLFTGVYHHTQIISMLITHCAYHNPKCYYFDVQFPFTKCLEHNYILSVSASQCGQTFLKLRSTIVILDAVGIDFLTRLNPFVGDLVKMEYPKYAEKDGEHCPVFRKQSTANNRH